ncbi:MAG: M67 family metallopeptidase [Sphingomonadaceae bacterium]
MNLTGATAATIRAAVHETPDIEACGMLFGLSASGVLHVNSASRAKNIAARPWNRFEIAPEHLFDAQRRHRAGPPWLVGIWHSHPNGDPTPSRYDAARITDRNWLWLIATRTAIAAWVPDGEGFRPVPLAILL